MAVVVQDHLGHVDTGFVAAPGWAETAAAMSPAWQKQVLSLSKGDGDIGGCSAPPSIALHFLQWEQDRPGAIGLLPVETAFSLAAWAKKILPKPYVAGLRCGPF
jgi:hypothetical protein